MGTPRYEMNPAEDVIMSGDDLKDGMWVLHETSYLRPGSEASEDERLRGQRFCRITRLKRNGGVITFIGEWVDGYQKTFTVHRDYNWLVKRDSVTQAGDAR